MSDFSSELERKYREKLEDMDTETRELQIFRSEIEESVTSISETFENRVRELTRLAAPRVKKQILLRLKFKVRELWSSLDISPKEQMSVLCNAIYLDELTRRGAESARNYITKELDTLYILKSMKKYHLAVSYMESLAHMLRKTVDAGSIRSPLHKRLQRQATRQKWSSVRAKIVSLAKHVEVLVKKWETRWNLTYTVMNRNGKRVPFRDSDWRVREYEVESMPLEINHSHHQYEGKNTSSSNSNFVKAELNILHEILKGRERKQGSSNEDEDEGDFELNRSMNSDVIRDSEQVVEDLDNSMSEIRRLYDEMRG